MEAYVLPTHRRSYDRYRTDDSATLLIDSQLERPAILRDLSCRGSGVVSDYPLGLDDKIEVVIRSSLVENPVRRKARVAWCNRIAENLYRAGLDFGFDIIEFS